MFDPATGTLVYTIVNPTGVQLQQFGDRQTLAVVGDVNGDGVTDLAVGAPNALRPDGFYGYVHLFSGATGALLRSCDSAPLLGSAVAAAGDLDGDGVPDVLTSGGNAPAGSVVALSGATCDVLVTLPSPLEPRPSPFRTVPLAINVVHASDDSAVRVFVGAYGRFADEPSEPEGLVYRVLVYRLGGIVAASPQAAPSGLSVTVSPNPSAGASSVTLTVAQGSSVRVVVVDAVGRVVVVLHDGPVSAGSVRLALPSGLAAGVYAVVAEGGGSAARARWVVAR